MNNFRFIIPVYNAEKYIEKCLSSVKYQVYSNWRAIIINDCSTDKTEEKILSSIQGDNRFQYVKNDINRQALYNCFRYIPYIIDDDFDIICFLDGDDYLKDNLVLEYLNYIYDKHTWLTYGQYETLSDGKIGCCGKINNISTYRDGINGGWCTSHLKTCRYFLWEKLKIEDFRDSSGNFIPSPAWDHHMMFSMIEMSTEKHIKFVEKVLYVYNNLNPISEDKKNVSYQEEHAKKARKFKKYSPLILKEKIDIIYTFQYNSTYFKSAVIRLLNSINSLRGQDVNFIIINGSDDCIYDIIKNLGIKIKYSHIKTKFGSKCALINYGTKKYVTKEYFLISDIDLIYPKNFVDKIISIKNKEVVSNIPVRIIFYNRNLIEEYFSHDYDSYKNKHMNSLDIAPGNGLIHIESFLKIRGFDEEMLGYGPEDGIFNLRISKINKYIETKEIFTYHQKHDRTNNIQVELNSSILYIKKNSIENSKNICEDIKANVGRTWAIGLGSI
jgi:glycosyltransferase involved in cell wall biosynthesis